MLLQSKGWGFKSLQVHNRTRDYMITFQFLKSLFKKEDKVEALRRSIALHIRAKSNFEDMGMMRLAKSEQEIISDLQRQLADLV